MRQFISIVMVFCLLKTHIHAIPPDLTDNNAEHGQVHVTIPTDGIAQSHVSSSVSETLTWLKNTVSYASNTPVGIAIIVPLFFTGIAYSLIYTLVFINCCITDTPFSVSRSYAMNSAPTTYAVPDTCVLPKINIQSHLFEYVNHLEHSGTALTLPQAVSEWLSNDHNSLDAIGAGMLDDRHGELTHEQWNAMNTNLFNVLFNHGLYSITPISCTFYLGNTSTRLDACHSGIHTTIKEGHAMLHLHPLSDKNRLMQKSVRLYSAPISEEQRYPKPLQSLDPKDASNRRVSRRQLLQTGNPLTLPQMVESVLKNRMDCAQLLFQIATQLHEWNPSFAEITALNTLVKSVFDAHGIVLTGQVTCGLTSSTGALNACSLNAASTGEKVTFNQATHNPALLGSIEVQPTLLSAKDALPHVLNRAAEALYAELNALRLHRCSAHDSSRIMEITTMVQEALDSVGVVMPRDIACDIAIKNSAIQTVACGDAVAPNGTESCDLLHTRIAHAGRVWITPNGNIMVAANPDWNTTATRNLPRTLSQSAITSATLSRPVTLSKTMRYSATPTPPITPTVPVVVAQESPKYIYWSDKYRLWRAAIAPINGSAVNMTKWIDNPITQSGIDSFYPDFKNGFLLFSIGESTYASRLFNATLPVASMSNQQELVTGMHTAYLSTTPTNTKVYTLFDSDKFLALTVNGTNPSQILKTTYLKTPSGGMYSLFVDEENGYVYKGNSAGINVANISDIAKTKYICSPDFPSKFAPIYGLYILGNNIYWKTDSTLYKGTVNRTHPTVYNITNYQLLLSSTIKYGFGGGGVFVQ